MNASAEMALLNGGSPILVWSLLGAVLLFLVVASAVRLLGPGQRAVVIRFGRARRVRGPGLVMNVPGLERVQVVSMSPTSTGGVTVRGRTDVGIRVILGIEAVYRILDPLVAIETPSRTATMLIDDLERIAQLEVSKASLTELLDDRESLATRLQVALNSRTSGSGIAVLDVQITTVEAELDRELLRLMR